MTFDDGPNPATTTEVLSILKKYNIKATFFVLGKNALEYPKMIQQIVAEGHVIGSHGYDHRNMGAMSSEGVVRELELTKTSVDKALGYEYHIAEFRPPYGSTSKTLDNVLDQYDMAKILWDVDSLDWRYKNSSVIMQNVFNKPGENVHVRGGVILFHDIHPQTVKVLEDVILKLKSENFQFVTTSDFLSKKYPS